MRSETHKLALGYYVMRNPNPSELKQGISFAEARENEERVSNIKFIN